MRQVFIVSFMFIFTASCYSQTNEQAIHIINKPYQLQGGLNVINFVRQFINFSGNGTNITTSPYAMNAKGFYHLKDENALIGLRLGMGYTNTDNSSSQSTTENSTYTETFDTRVGIEFQKMITKRWVAYAGLDYISSSRLNSTKNVFFNSSTNTNDVTSNVNKTMMDGGGLVLGIQFNLNKYFSLSTEATYYYFDSWGSQSNFSSNIFNNQPTSYSKSKGTQLILPNLVNFNFMF